MVCLPTYNERENLEPMLRAIGEVSSEHGIDARVLVIDDSSPDGTGELADRLARELDFVSVLHRPKKEGLGPAYVAGFREALATDAELRQWADRHRVRVLIAEAGAPLPQAETGPVALVVGNEGAGISDSLSQMAAGKVGIPLRGGAESLNVAIAAGILLYEVTRD